MSHRNSREDAAAAGSACRCKSGGMEQTALYGHLQMINWIVTQALMNYRMTPVDLLDARMLQAVLIRNEEQGDDVIYEYILSDLRSSRSGIHVCTQLSLCVFHVVTIMIAIVPLSVLRTRGSFWQLQADHSAILR